MATLSEAMAIAVAHHQAGRLWAAEQIYRQILAVEPEHTAALHLLGVVAHQRGNHEAAVEHIARAIRLEGDVAGFHSNLGEAYRALRRFPEAIACQRRALELKPEMAEAHYNLGLALKEQGNLDEAVESYRRSLLLKPESAATHNNLGVALQEQGKQDEAAESFRRAVQLKPDFAEAHYNLGVVGRDQGKLDEAAACYRRVAALKPDSAEAQNNLGAICRRLERLDEAVAAYRRALELKPDYAEAHFNLGVALGALGKADEAVACYRRALELKPDMVEAWNNLGNIWKDQEQLDEAAAAYRRALQLRPDYPEGHYNLGAVCKDQGNLEEAIACNRRALELKPDYAEAYYNLGNGLKDQGKLDEAIASYGRALDLNPDYAEAHWNRSLLWLLTGDFARGWPEYEWRWRTAQVSSRTYPQPLWDGGPLAGRTILLHAEQGLGDTIQFVRYASLVKRLGATVFVECQKPLQPLLASCAGIDQLFGEGDGLPEFAVQTPLLSLPRIFQTSAASIPAGVPYLFAAPALIESWRAKLGEVRGYRIGINWQGRPKPGHWRQRSIPLRQFATLAAIPGVRLIGLQKGPGREELKQAEENIPVLDLGDEVDEAAGAFMDTAAIMMNLDLVITSDTAAAHLAGSLGVAVWLALPWAPDWRWLLDRGDSPWYPTMRLFRQRQRGDWEGVFAELKQALCERLRSSADAKDRE
jgi:tetratricopeptide (TPR) repeat protein